MVNRLVARGKVVAQELQSQQIVMAHCQVLWVAAKQLGIDAVCVLVEGGSGPDSLPSGARYAKDNLWLKVGNRYIVV